MKKTSYLIIIIILNSFYLIQEAKAIPAYPYKVTVNTDNGKSVDIFMQGDEYIKFAITQDGYSILCDSDGWWYAEEKENGEVGKSSFKLLAYEDETQELKTFKLSCPKRLIPSNNINNVSRRSITRVSSNKNTPIIGNKKALVILMQYRDLAFKHSQEEFDKLFNTLNYNEGGATGSVRDYYRFASQNQLDYISDIYGPYTSAYPMSYYGKNDAKGNDINPVELCKEALENLPKDIDLSIYDNNNDGIIDYVHIIFAGYGEEAGASSDAIWSHEYPHSITVNNGSNITIAGYSCSPELRGNMNANITYIGVICHELGHALGAMDYYDTNYGTGGEYVGTGKWDIMASGSWNDEGKNPANFNPYVRSSVFGWSEQILLVPDIQIVMPRMEIDNSNSTVIYRMETGCDGDYFLLENRQKYSFDEGLPGEGLMIYHVHPNIERYSASNTINASHPQLLYPVCASGSSPKKMNYGNINSAECPFPGLTCNTSFSSQSNPASWAWDGSAARVLLSSIKMNEEDGSVSFHTEKDNGSEPDEPDVPVEGDIIYKESFENGMAEGYDVESVMGKEVWSIYKKGSFILNPNSIPEATDGYCILMLYSPKSDGISESVIKSPFIDLSDNGDYSMSFDVFCDSKTTLGEYSFIFTVEDSFGICASFQLEKATDGWMKVKLPLSLNSNAIRFNIRASLMTGGIFVDNICILSDNSSGIKQEKDNTHEYDKTFVYSMNGSLLGEKDRLNLSPGLYILRCNGNTTKIIVQMSSCMGK